MITDAWLAYAHILSILTLTVFLGSEAALCRSDWLNGAALKRLARVDLYYGLAAVAVLVTGLMRVYWGTKGSGWYWTNWLLHTKLTLFIVIGILSIGPTLKFRRWVRAFDATGALPPDVEVRGVRRLVMISAHLLVIIPLAAVFMARGFGH